MSVKQFTIATNEAREQAIKQRVADFVWPAQMQLQPEENAWAYGMDQDWLRDFCAYWVNEYRWQDTVDELNRFDHFTAEMDGLNIHFIREDGSGETPEVLLMTHGWPGSVYEFIEVIDRLAHPEKYGGRRRRADRHLPVSAGLWLFRCPAASHRASDDSRPMGQVDARRAGL